MKWVVKIGGSLHDSPELARVARRAGDFDSTVLLVPGGGPFADQVRVSQKRWGFDDRRAHSMALLAMRQYGLLLAALGGYRVTGRAEMPAAGVTVWLPGEALPGAGLAANWDVSSDSVAAWLAREVGADWLVLVKPVPFNNSRPPRGLVDAAFARTAGPGLRCAMADVGQWLAGDFSCEAFRFAPG